MNKKSKRRIKRGMDFNKEIAKGKYGWSEVASERRHLRDMNLIFQVTDYYSYG